MVNPCECICNPDATLLAQLMQILRLQNGNEINDSSSEQLEIPGDLSQILQTASVAAIWLFIFGIAYVFRPISLRRNQNGNMEGKQRRDSNDHYGNGSPPPPL